MFWTPTRLIGLTLVAICLGLGFGLRAYAPVLWPRYALAMLIPSVISGVAGALLFVLGPRCGVARRS